MVLCRDWGDFVGCCGGLVFVGESERCGLGLEM